MTTTHFFRLLKTDIGAKGAHLAEQVQAVNAGQPAPETFAVEPTEFKQIPGSPFAYWVSDSFRRLFSKLPSLGEQTDVRQGLVTADDFRFLRAWWEEQARTLGYTAQETCQGYGWVHFAKGGAYSPFYADVHLIVDWANEGDRIRNFFGPNGRVASRPQNIEYYFRSGLTWSLRTQAGLNMRAMPSGCIFSHKGPAVFVLQDNQDDSLFLQAVLNSLAFRMSVELQMAFGSYEVGVIQRTPIPLLMHHATPITFLAREAHDVARDLDYADEVTHTFCLPGLVHHKGKSLLKGSLALQAQAQASQARLRDIQSEIDEIAFDLYGLSEADRDLVRAEMGATEYETRNTNEEAEDEDESATSEDLSTRVANLLMWCLGCAFGRWDVRFALDPTLLPKLQDPFDPLPRCSPGMLVGPDGLPANKGNIVSEAWLRARPNVITLPDAATLGTQPSTIPNTEYPLPIAWFGIIPDDDGHPEDVVQCVRDVLELLWGDRAEAIEQEACDALGVESLRDYFRQPKAFFDLHIKRYSKSRRKAPIYWLLQSAKRNYGLWLYYPRMDPDTLFKVLTLYADPKLALENIRLGDLRAQLTPDLAARDRRALDKAIAKQEALIGELKDFRNELERVARLGLPPDMNDGVIISIAPLHNLVPWKEAERMWVELEQGQVEWSSMSRRMREKGLVKKGKG